MLFLHSRLLSPCRRSLISSSTSVAKVLFAKSSDAHVPPSTLTTLSRSRSSSRSTPRILFRSPATATAAAPAQLRKKISQEISRKGISTRSRKGVVGVGIMGAAAQPSLTLNDLNVGEDLEVVMRGRANDVYQVVKYRSKSTGLEVVHAAIEGPIVNGYIVLATRASDDDGLPHTLEHLIFMGSEDYPYKGVLDILANKCFASGTNAWTDVDHTAYTLTTAGSEGFCAMLPIYLDHIFHPILSETSFTTEVYHTTGEGLDGGVVYCELQAKENTAEERVYNSLVRTIYPPTSGYHYQTGGICKNIRDSCNNTKVKEFHAKFYNPRNTCLIVCGTVAPEALFKALEPTILKLQSKGGAPTWEKPWLEDIPEIPGAVEIHVKFPAEDDEEESVVTVGFRGPSAIREIDSVAALRLLFEYLTDSSVAPIQASFVENDDPLCAGVSYAEMENSQTTFYIEFEGVGIKKDKMTTLLPKLRSTLEKQLKSFDLARMGDIIKKNYQEELSSMENTPHNSIAYAVIGDFLYGSDDKTMFDKRINAAKTINGFLEKDKNFWTGLLKEKILGQKWVTIYAHPSKETADALAKEEEGRVAERRLRLGEPGLTKMAYDLEEAIKSNGAPAPSSVMEKVGVPCADSINFHSIRRYENPDFATGLGCNFYLDDIKSSFVYVSVHMDASSCTYEQMKYLPLLREVIVESPVQILGEDGVTKTLLSFEDVVADINRTWLSHGCSLGIDGGGRFKAGSYCHAFTLNCQMQLAKVEPGFEWIRRLLFDTQWDEGRTKVIAAKMLGDIPQMKRKGNRMAYTLLKDVLYRGRSTVKTASLIRQQKFLKGVASTSGKELGAMFEGLRKVLTAPQNMTIHIATSLDKLREVATATKAASLEGLLAKTFAFPEGTGTATGLKRLANDPDLIWMREEASFRSSPELWILGNRSEDSAYMVKVAPGPKDWMDPELPLLLTAMQYLCQTEGPFYRGIRGAGLAYDFFLDARCNEGLIYFNLYRCTDIVTAFKVAKEIIEAHMTSAANPEDDIWSEEFLSSAKSSLIFEYIEGEKTPLALASTSLCSYYRNVPGGYTRDIIAKIMGVELSQLKPIVEKYLLPIFAEDHAASIVAPQDKVVSIIEGFDKVHGKKLQPVTGIANSFLEKWEEE